MLFGKQIFKVYMHLFYTKKKIKKKKLYFIIGNLYMMHMYH